MFKKQYGDPWRDRIRWEDETYKEDPSKWGKAISNGDLYIKYTWKDRKDTELELIILHGGRLELEYSSKDYL